MSVSSPAVFYEAQLQKYTALLAGAAVRARRLSQCRLIAVLAGIGFAAAAVHEAAGWLWWACSACLMIFLALVRLHSRVQHTQQLLQIHVHLIGQEQAALAGDISAFESGNAYIDSVHPYSYDLDIFGTGSVYQLLNRTVTVNGGIELADHLKDALADKRTILESQQIVRELSQMPQFLQDFRVAGTAVPEAAPDYAQVVDWLHAKDDFISSPVAKIAMIGMPLIVVTLIGWSVAIGSLHEALPVAVLVNWIILMSFGRQIRAANARIGKTAGLVEKYQRLQEQAAVPGFRHSWLQQVSSQSRRALRQILRFRRLANLFDSRNNSLAGPLMNSLFLFDIYCLLRLESWRRAHRQELLATMEALIALDVFVSCATYAFNHPEHSYPEINTAGTTLSAGGLRHPLLLKGAVGNDFSLGRNEQFYLLTGANMTGKSTFIRTVGVNVVLAYLGLPVPADHLSLPLFRLYTSMRVTDSVQDDISYFRAELNRIKAIMEAVQTPGMPYLLLLDEPLRGTNSGDKQQGTRSILETLLRQKATGIVATHDIGLCTLAQEHPGQVSNYHFESTVTATGLSFDFKLRPGGSTSNNATTLMRQMGIIQ